ncbi:hypothetical protein KCU95_g1412, partial [Aureobasidium melanogenum]
MPTQSTITQQELSSDVLESPVYQNLEVCFQRYLTWLSSHEIGLALTLETSLLDAAKRVHHRLDRQVNYYSPYEIPLEHYSQLQQHLVEMTVYCRRVASYVGARRLRTFNEFATLTGYPVSQIKEAWDLRCFSPSAEELCQTVTKWSWERIEEARWRAEMAWRCGHTNQRPAHLRLMPRRRVIIDEILDYLAVAPSTSTLASTTLSSSISSSSTSSPSTSASTTSSSTSTSTASSSSTSSSQSETTISRDLEALSDRTRRPEES